MLAGIGKKRSTLLAKKARYGYLFVLPLIFGLVFMFIIPMIRSLVFSFSDVSITSGSFSTKFLGFYNYYNALFINTTFREYVVISLQNTLINVPVIIVFAFFSASLMNSNFKGRGVVRAIFLLPIALASTSIIYMDASEALQSISSGSSMKESELLAGGLKTSGAFLVSLLRAGLPSNVVDYLSAASDRIYEIVLYSGVPMLIILAGLQSIPKSLYEAAAMEGATTWESFWKITFPMSNSLVLTATVYAVIDSFRAATNLTFSLVQYNTYTVQNFGLAAAMSWIYFVFIILLIGVVFLIFRKAIYYGE